MDLDCKRTVCQPNKFELLFYLGVIGDFLRWKAWVPLSRLTLGAYLIHAVVTLRFIYAQMSLVEITQDNMVSLIHSEKFKMNEELDSLLSDKVSNFLLN